MIAGAAILSNATVITTDENFEKNRRNRHSFTINIIISYISISLE